MSFLFYLTKNLLINNYPSFTELHPFLGLKIIENSVQKEWRRRHDCTAETQKNPEFSEAAVLGEVLPEPCPNYPFLKSIRLCTVTTKLKGRFDKLLGDFFLKHSFYSCLLFILFRLDL